MRKGMKVDRPYTRRMASSRGVRGSAAAAAVLGLSLGLSGCLYSAIPAAVPGASASWSADDADLSTEDLVVVVFALDSEFGGEDLLDAMWPVEEEALAAIEDAGLGYLDGNDVGAGEYSLYFYGDDRARMWELLEPIMRTAPVPLARVELWPSGEGTEPEVLTFEDAAG